MLCAVFFVLSSMRNNCGNANPSATPYPVIPFALLKIPFFLLKRFVKISWTYSQTNLIFLWEPAEQIVEIKPTSFPLVTISFFVEKLWVLLFVCVYPWM